MKRIFLLLCLLVGLAFARNDFLEPEDAFKVSFSQNEKAVVLDVKLGKDIYIYDEQTKLFITKPKLIEITKEVKFPTPVEHHDFIVHLKDFSVEIPKSLIASKVGESSYELEFQYQGCSNAGLCYAPMSLKKEFSQKTSSKIQKQNNTENISQSDAITQKLKDSNIFIILITFFGFGLLLSLTPCVFPMIPILSGIIIKAGEKEKLTTSRGFFLSLIYVLSMSVAYALAGVVAGVFGANLQVALQNPYVLSIFALVFVALAFSMFGYFKLELPQSLQNKINKTTEGKEKNGVAGIAIMGFLSALIVGPCVAPPLAGALVYIGQTGDALLGGLALFIMSIGMGMPLLLIGMGAGKFMPRAGGWMESVSKFFGIIMLAVALWLLDRVIPAYITIYLWGALLLGLSIFLSNNTHIISKIISKLFYIFAFAVIIGAISGATNPLAPFEKFTNAKAQSSKTSDATLFKRVKTINELENAIKASSKPVMIDFYADWCISCKELEHNTFSNQEVQKRFEDFTLLQIDVTQNTKDDKELMQKYNVFGPPAIIFYDKNSNEMKSAKIIGYLDAKDFLAHLNQFFK